MEVSAGPDKGVLREVIFDSKGNEAVEMGKFSPTKQKVTTLSDAARKSIEHSKKIVKGELPNPKADLLEAQILKFAQMFDKAIKEHFKDMEADHHTTSSNPLPEFGGVTINEEKGPEEKAKVVMYVNEKGTVWNSEGYMRDDVPDGATVIHCIGFPDIPDGKPTSIEESKATSTTPLPEPGANNVSGISFSPPAPTDA
jgi:hypothetical protein